MINESDGLSETRKNLWGEVPYAFSRIRVRNVLGCILVLMVVPFMG